MSDVLTPNYGLTKPDVGGSDDTWGDKLNVNFDILDSSLKGVSNAILVPPSPATAVPLVEAGTGSVGVSVKYAREDHVHPLGPGGGGGGGAPSDTNPVMDSVAAPGVSNAYSRGDHVHPSDTSRAAVTYVDAQTALKVSKAGDTMTGALRGGNIFLGTGVEVAAPLPAKLEITHNSQPSALVVGGGGGNMQLLYYPDAVTPANGVARFSTASYANPMTFDASSVFFQTASGGNRSTSIGGTLSVGYNGTTGSLYFGNTTAHYLNYDNTNFNFVGGGLICSVGAIFGPVSSVSTSTTGIYYFGNGNAKYLQYDGANFNLAGGNLQAQAILSNSSGGTQGAYYFGGYTKSLNYDGTNFNLTGGLLVATAPTPPVGDNSTNLATTAFVQRVRNSVNRVINGQFRIDQRNSGAVVNPANHGLFCDMWRAVFAAGVPNYYGQQYAWMVQGHCTAQINVANTKFGLVTKIEQRDCADLRSKTVVASATIYPTTATITNFRMAILEWTGTVDAMTNPISAWNAAGTNPTLAAGYVYVNTPVNLAITTQQPNSVQVSGNVSGSMNNLSVLIWSDGVNAAGDYYNISDVQLEAGSVASVYDRRPYGQELSLCQRYAWTWRNANATNQHVASGGAISATQFFINMPNPVEMRIPSTGAVISSPTVFNTLIGGAVLTLAWNAGGLTDTALLGTVAGGFANGNFTSLYTSSIATISITGAEM